MGNLTVLVSLLFGINLLLVLTSATSFHCNQTYSTSDGKICFYCTPGTYRSGDCERSGESALCKACDRNHYQKDCNIAASCAECSPNCKEPYTFKVAACSMFEDIQCRCIEGRYWKIETDSDGVCLAHSKCPVGQGLLDVGNHKEDTRCQPCKEGETFSPESSFDRCQTCKKCKLYKKRCTSSSDAECDLQETTDASVKDKDSADAITVGQTIGISAGGVVFVLCVGLTIVAIRRCMHRTRDRNSRHSDDKSIEIQNGAFVGDYTEGHNGDVGAQGRACLNGTVIEGRSNNNFDIETEIRDSSKQTAVPSPDSVNDVSFMDMDIEIDDQTSMSYASHDNSKIREEEDVSVLEQSSDQELGIGRGKEKTSGDKLGITEGTGNLIAQATDGRTGLHIEKDLTTEKMKNNSKSSCSYKTENYENNEITCSSNLYAMEMGYEPTQDQYMENLK